MDIVEFVEKVTGLELLDFQKKYLTELYDLYKKDPDSFAKFTYPCRRGSAIFDAKPVFDVIFSLSDKEVLEKQRDERY